MSLKNWSTTAGSNATVDSINFAEGQAPSSVNDSARALMADVRAGLYTKGSDIASATTTDLAAASTEGLFHDITGTTTITGLGTVAAGVWKVVKFEGALTLTHNATSLILPGAANITTADGDIGIFVSEGSGNWRCVNYMTAGIPKSPYGQIPFPATQNPSSDVNTLDDYEEGTWTTTVSSATNFTGTPTLSSGKYIKVGRLCSVQGVFSGTVTSANTLTFLRFTLPFDRAAAADAGAGSASSVTNIRAGLVNNDGLEVGHGYMVFPAASAIASGADTFQVQFSYVTA